jgi:hypothetical protein
MDEKLKYLIAPGLQKDCLSTRRFIVDNHENLADLSYYYLVRLNSNLEHECEGDSVLNLSVIHLHNCSKCEHWLDNEFPKEYVSRPFRLAHYCCGGMFVAVEEYKERENAAVKFKRGATSCGGAWSLGGWLISYCPWCSTKLPNKPFRNLDLD